MYALSTETQYIGLYTDLGMIVEKIGISCKPDWVCHCFYPFEKILSHIPMHTRSSDPYVGLLSEKSVPHRYPCKISVSNTRKATRGRLLRRDNIFGA